MTLRVDDKAHLYWVPHLLFWRAYYFESTGVGPVRFTSREFDQMARRQDLEPTAIAFDGRRRWWWFEETFYWENEGLEPGDVLALVRARQRRQQKALERARDLLALDGGGVTRREPIPREVRREVYDRDGGSCVECGSSFDLQYDHIIPVSRGGATNAENLQLLCAACNREKSDSF